MFVYTRLNSRTALTRPSRTAPAPAVSDSAPAPAPAVSDSGK